MTGRLERDSNVHHTIEWEMADGCWKRAWIQDRSGSDKDWAGTGKYLNVARVDGPGIGSRPFFEVNLVSLSHAKVF